MSDEVDATPWAPGMLPFLLALLTHLGVDVATNTWLGIGASELITAPFLVDMLPEGDKMGTSRWLVKSVSMTFGDLMTAVAWEHKVETSFWGREESPS